jgi:hypothetical protein
MRYLLPIAVLTLALGGCSRENELPSSSAPAFAPAAATFSSGATTPSPAATKGPHGKDYGKLPPGQHSPNGLDEFNLPLVILFDMPEPPPPAIEKPSPPIPDDTKKSGTS